MLLFYRSVPACAHRYTRCILKSYMTCFQMFLTPLHEIVCSNLVCCDSSKLATSAGAKPVIDLREVLVTILEKLCEWPYATKQLGKHEHARGLETEQHLLLFRKMSNHDNEQEVKEMDQERILLSLIVDRGTLVNLTYTFDTCRNQRPALHVLATQEQNLLSKSAPSTNTMRGQL